MWNRLVILLVATAFTVALQVNLLTLRDANVRVTVEAALSDVKLYRGAHQVFDNAAGRRLLGRGRERERDRDHFTKEDHTDLYTIRKNRDMVWEQTTAARDALGSTGKGTETTLIESRMQMSSLSSVVDNLQALRNEGEDTNQHAASIVEKDGAAFESNKGELDRLYEQQDQREKRKPRSSRPRQTSAQSSSGAVVAVAQPPPQAIFADDSFRGIRPEDVEQLDDGVDSDVEDLKDVIFKLGNLVSEGEENMQSAVEDSLLLTDSYSHQSSQESQMVHPSNAADAADRKAHHTTHHHRTKMSALATKMSNSFDKDSQAQEELQMEMKRLSLAEDAVSEKAALVEQMRRDLELQKSVLDSDKRFNAEENARQIAEAEKATAQEERKLEELQRQQEQSAATARSIKEQLQAQLETTKTDMQREISQTKEQIAAMQHEADEAQRHAADAKAKEQQLRAEEAQLRTKMTSFKEATLQELQDKAAAAEQQEEKAAQAQKRAKELTEQATEARRLSAKVEAEARKRSSQASHTLGLLKDKEKQLQQLQEEVNRQNAEAALRTSQLARQAEENALQEKKLYLMFQKMEARKAELAEEDRVRAQVRGLEDKEVWYKQQLQQKEKYQKELFDSARQEREMTNLVGSQALKTYGHYTPAANGGIDMTDNSNLFTDVLKGVNNNLKEYKVQETVDRMNAKPQSIFNFQESALKKSIHTARSFQLNDPKGPVEELFTGAKAYASKQRALPNHGHSKSQKPKVAERSTLPIVKIDMDDIDRILKVDDEITIK